MTTRRRSKKLQRLIDELADDSVTLADGFDSAIVGIGSQFNHWVAVYDADKCIVTLAKQGMSYDEAAEYFDYNVAGAYVGEGTPIFIRFR